MAGKSVSINKSVATSAYRPTAAPARVPPMAAAMVSSTLDLLGGGGGFGLLWPNGREILGKLIDGVASFFSSLGGGGGVGLSSFGGSDFPKLGRRSVGLFEAGGSFDSTAAALGASFFVVVAAGGGVSGFFFSSGAGVTLSENPGMNNPVVDDSVSSSLFSSPSSVPDSDVARKQRSSLLRQR